MLDELYIPEEFLKGYFSWWEHIGGALNDLSQRGHFLIQYPFQGQLFLLIDGAFVVQVDFFSPKFLQSDLFLDFALEHSELRWHSECGEEGVAFLEGDGLCGSFGRLG